MAIWESNSVDNLLQHYKASYKETCSIQCLNFASFLQFHYDLLSERTHELNKLQIEFLLLTREFNNYPCAMGKEMCEVVS